jgi:crotonobetainyl-CoA:carnitine CoA-transferase CaiB-like acyl-CoA transferase
MPLKFSEFPQDLPLQAATLGQHNREVLRDLLGRSDDEIRTLRDANVLVKGEC